MCYLLDFPNELLTQIVEDVSPTEGLEAFTLSCRKVFICGERALTSHPKMKKKWSKCGFGSIANNVPQGRTAYKYLHDILHEDSILPIIPYVTTITIAAGDETLWCRPWCCNDSSTGINEIRAKLTALAGARSIEEKSNYGSRLPWTKS